MPAAKYRGVGTVNVRDAHAVFRLRADGVAFALIRWRLQSRRYVVKDPENVPTPNVLPRPDFRFPGEVGRTYLDSDPAQFPQPTKAPKGAPNVLLLLIDDCGFGQYSTFGGGIPSPTMDKLAAEGLRYNRRPPLLRGWVRTTRCAAPRWDRRGVRGAPGRRRRAARPQ